MRAARDESVQPVKWGLYTFALLLGLTGIIMTLIGGVRIYRLSPTEARQQELEPYLVGHLNCDDYANMLFANQSVGKAPKLPHPIELTRALGDWALETAAVPPPSPPARNDSRPSNETRNHDKDRRRGGHQPQAPPAAGANTTERFSDARGVYARQCRSRWEPYVYLFAITSFLKLAELAFAAYAFQKESRGPLYYLAVHAALTLALLFVCFYAFLQSTKAASEKLVDCSDFSQESRSLLHPMARHSALGVCTDGRPLADDFQRNFTVFNVGTAFQVLANLLLLAGAALTFDRSTVLVAVPVSAAYGAAPAAATVNM